MNLKRTGKIARLPLALRDQLNLRLQNGERARVLVEWLNARPEVQAVLASGFDGKPIREQNLSDWKKGGYRDWLEHQATLELGARLADEAEEWRGPDAPRLTEPLVLLLIARYALATRDVSQTSSPEGWRKLRELCGDVSRLRNSDYLEHRLRLDRERLDLRIREAEMRSASREKKNAGREPRNAGR